MHQNTLLEKLRQGDESATKSLYLRIRRKFLPWIQQYGCPTEEASDWLHLSFATMLENIRQRKLTELSSTLDTYCMSIGKNQYLAAQRQQQRTQTVIEHFQNVIELDDYEQREVIAQQLHTVRTALEQLGDPCRKLLVAFYHYQQNWQEIATEMGYTSAANARNQKYKCLLRLRKMVGQT